MIATIARQVLMLWSATHQHDWSLEKKLGFDSQIWYDAWPTKCCASIIPCHGVVKLEPMILYGYQVPFADSQISWIRNHSKTNGTITEHLSQESCNPSLLSWCKRLRDRGSVLEKMGNPMGIPCPRDRKHSVLAGNLAQNGVIGFCQGLQV